MGRALGKRETGRGGERSWDFLIQLDKDQERAPLSDAVLVASRQFTEMLNRGKLTADCLNVVREICFMWRALTCTEETRVHHANSSCEGLSGWSLKCSLMGCRTFSAQLAEEEKQGRRGEKTDDCRMKNTRSI
ncbi:hypothetical protein GWK47_051106 [Chionoecetes opilio]|uniref:Uncharacterized protein n=1 Tax=Chionoecetes opilio TaxID=41210 RepID=A0A8J4Y299_CHIOP|nr:hypothetical protein GWK47_051106 [Chionoecetes opilio]